MTSKKRELTGPVMRWPDAQNCAGVGSSALRVMIENGAFPKPFKVSDSGRAVVFLRSEVERWLADRIAKRDGKPAPEPKPEQAQPKKKQRARAGASA